MPSYFNHRYNTLSLTFQPSLTSILKPLYPIFAYCPINNSQPENILHLAHNLP